MSTRLIEMNSYELKVKAVDKKAPECKVANSALVDLILAKLLNMTATTKFIIIP